MGRAKRTGNRTYLVELAGQARDEGRAGSLMYDPASRRPRPTPW